MYKIMIRLEEPIFNALIKSAKDEKRGTREQAEWIICERLKQQPAPPTELKESARERIK